MARYVTAILAVLALPAGWLAWAENTTVSTSGPATQPATHQQVLDKLLGHGPPVTAPKLSAQPSRWDKWTKKGTGPVLSLQNTRRVGAKLLPEGDYLADRRGRLAQRGKQLVFVFESDGKSLADPPITLLPNRWLEKMEADVTASPELMTFRISGEVTTYRGRNYLLLRKVLIERRLDQRYPK